MVLERLLNTFRSCDISEEADGSFFNRECVRALFFFHLAIAFFMRINCVKQSTFVLTYDSVNFPTMV